MIARCFVCGREFDTHDGGFACTRCTYTACPSCEDVAFPATKIERLVALKDGSQQVRLINGTRCAKCGTRYVDGSRLTDSTPRVTK